ncbi:penicillin-binding protein [Neolewinella aurantiaca]|uniref:Penicillin-binding protein n=1 Tax=Neolewinella aurantiaca TaxID=2602767 RepID=A0A5C7FEK8_9BACT|nr:transglycosylase domain-containing protein [Neolewinella aurantiaca]TXF89562.1 penicillin-binding protein [Neolewinella aurantiaca]
MDKHFFYNLQSRARQLGLNVWAWVRRQPPLKLAFAVIALLVLVTTVLFLTLFIRTLGGNYGHMPEHAELALIENSEASSVISEDGKLLGKYFRENRVSVELDEISPYVIQALIATEDSRFFEHQGIDLRALARVAWRSIILGDRSGGGGSTISQQLAKQLYPRHNSGKFGMIKIKMREMIIASRLEEVYDKQELLALYLNTVPFGENAYGIEVAAGRFFSKSAADLKAEEAAVLVGLLKANTSYNPRAHPERSRERRDLVLALMAQNGSLEKTVTDSLAALPLVIDYQRQNDRVGSATYFRHMLRAEAEKALAGKKRPDSRPWDIDRDGLLIHVSVNSVMQRLAEEAVLEQLPRIQQNLAIDWKSAKRAPWEDAFMKTVKRSPRYKNLEAAGKNEDEIMEVLRQPRPMTIYDWKTADAVDTMMRPIDSLRHYFTLLNAGLLATEPENGVVRAWVGGVDYRFVQYDHVTARRQVGSTIKPVIYATALQRGMLPCEYTPAQQFTIEDFQNYNPRNPGGNYEGAYSMRGGLAKSVNTVAVNLAVRSGLQNVVDEIHELGITGKVEAIPSVALGTVEATLPEMNTVFSAFANGGRRPTGGIHFLDKITTADGETIVSFVRPKKTMRVMSDTVANITTFLMTGVVNNGTGARLRSTYGVSGALAGKTGTTQDQSDGWFVGYNPKLVVSTWVGAEYPAVHFRTLRRGSATATALPVWGTFMRKVQRTRGLGRYHGGSFPRLDEMTVALLECPDYLEELPVYAEYGAPDPEDIMSVNEIRARLAEFPAQDVEQMMARKRRRNNESTLAYTRRIIGLLERDNRRDERKAKRKEFWAKTLFGKKD